jgi:hypothetical protein
MKEFVELVSKMRTAQRAYFKAAPQTQQKRDALDLSKKLEGEVDKFISSYQSPQKSMFPIDKNGNGGC